MQGTKNPTEHIVMYRVKEELKKSRKDKYNPGRSTSENMFNFHLANTGRKKITV